MKMIITISLVMLMMVSSAGAQVLPQGDSDHATWCAIGKNEYLHVQLGRQVIRRGYDRNRYPDRTPMRPFEKLALYEHKFCLKSPALRWRIERYRNRVERHYDRRFVS